MILTMMVTTKVLEISYYFNPEMKVLGLGTTVDPCLSGLPGGEPVRPSESNNMFRKNLLVERKIS